MPNCLNCGRSVHKYSYHEQEYIFCSPKCENTYHTKELPLNRPCACCDYQIIISEGFYVKKKQVYCSIECLTNLKT